MSENVVRSSVFRGGKVLDGGYSYLVPLRSVICCMGGRMKRYCEMAVTWCKVLKSCDINVEKKEDNSKKKYGRTTNI
jgi:hypothetical protein